jgi:hypothetical protein
MRKKPVLKYVVSALLVLVAGFAGIVALQSSDFRVTRSATIAAAFSWSGTVEIRPVMEIPGLPADSCL